jgi:molybdopterin-guanine dinucleotide biosynthesis protein A
MGTDKSRLPWRGMTLLEYVARAVEAAAGTVTIVGGTRHPDLRFIDDEFPRFGPLGGIATALADSPADWTLITACDMPGLTGEWLRGLLERAEGQALVPRTPDGRIHPLAAVWHRSAGPKIREAVLGGIHTVREAVQALDCRWLEVADSGWVRNVNTPGDWARLRE